MVPTKSGVPYPSSSGRVDWMPYAERQACARLRPPSLCPGSSRFRADRGHRPFAARRRSVPSGGPAQSLVVASSEAVADIVLRISVSPDGEVTGLLNQKEVLTKLQPAIDVVVRTLLERVPPEERAGRRTAKALSSALLPKFGEQWASCGPRSHGGAAYPVTYYAWRYRVESA